MITGLRIDRLPRFNIALQILSTFLLTCFARIFFRADSVEQAFTIIKKIVTLNSPGFYKDTTMLFYSLIGIFLLMATEFKEEFYQGRFSLLYNRRWTVRTLTCAFLILLIVMIGVFDGGQFIYFQF
jgi:hypothetical protein